LNSQRDWGHAKDYVEAMWRILQQDMPRLCNCNRCTTYIRDFVMAFAEVGVTPFEGEQENETATVVLVLILCIR
jgi:GDPmannose 4,6-dehydratase